jgi:hypothetical protein
MSEKEPMGSGEPRHEKRDVSVGKVALFGLGLVALIVLIGSIIPVLFFKYMAVETAPPPPRSPLFGKQELPPEPRLERVPGLEFQKIRAAEEQQLNSYGWVDKSTGTVRIPIERAMDLIALHGLPQRPDVRESAGTDKSKQQVGTQSSNSGQSPGRKSQ